MFVVVLCFGRDGFAQFPTSPLPTPTGKFAIGTTILPIEKSKKTGTHRRIQLWYPVNRGSRAPRASYGPGSETMLVIRDVKLMDQTPNVYQAWQTMKTNAAKDVPILTSAQKRPLVFLLPGQGMPVLLYTSYAQQLASDGYVVAAVDFGSGGFLVDGMRQVHEDPRGDDEATYGKIAADWAKQVSEILDGVKVGQKGARGSVARRVFARADLSRVGIVGHSLGGAAALEAARTDKRVRACIDLDGIPLGYVDEHGIETAALMLRSHVDYSDEDLKRLNRTREQWDERGRQAKEGLKKLIEKPGGDVWILSIEGTNHVSYSDCPFVMPQAISHWGGKILDASRFLNLWTLVVEGYLQSRFGSASFPPQPLPKGVVLQLGRSLVKARG